MSGKLHHRWAIRRDWPEIAEIERQSFGTHGWNEDEINQFNKNLKAICKVVEDGEIVIGWLAYLNLKDHLRIESLGVLQDCRRQGVGRAMLADLFRRMRTKHKCIKVRSAWWNNGAHQFLRRCEFRCVGLKNHEFDCGNVACYEFEWTPARREVVA